MAYLFEENKMLQFYSIGDGCVCFGTTIKYRTSADKGESNSYELVFTDFDVRAYIPFYDPLLNSPHMLCQLRPSDVTDITAFVFTPICDRKFCIK